MTPAFDIRPRNVPIFRARLPVVSASKPNQPEVFMPPATRRDELLDDVRDRLVRVEETLTKMAATLARVEAAEEQSKQSANEHRLQHEAIAERLMSLETTRSQAQGAAKFAKFIWAGLAAIGTYLLTNYLGGKTK